MKLADTLLWLCKVASPIGEEAELCDAVTKLLNKTPLAHPIRRFGDSIVVPLTRGFFRAPHRSTWPPRRCPY